MQIFFRTITGRSITVNVEAETTFKALKEQLAEKSGVPVDEQKILCRGGRVDASDESQLGDINIGQPPEGFLKVAQTIPTLHLIQSKSNSKPDLKLETLNFQAPKLYWRLRQLERTSAATDKYLVEEEKLASVTVCKTLEQAFQASQTRQKHNIGNNQISIIEAVVIDESQNLKFVDAGKKYGAHAISLFSSGEELFVKVATVGYFKQASPEFVTLREQPKDNSEQNQKIAAEINSAIGQLLGPSGAVIGSEALGASQEVSRMQMIENFFRSEENLFPAGSLRYKIYEALIDPVSLEIMKNPVILIPSRQTLDQKSAEGLKICPITRIRIEKIESNEAIKAIVNLLSTSNPEDDGEMFRQALNQLIKSLNYDKEAVIRRNFRLENIIECLEAENQKRLTLNSGQNPTIPFESASESILNPDNSVAASKVSQENIDRITQALQAYVSRVDGYEQGGAIKYRSNLSFSFFQDSQAVNREANYKLAQALLELVKSAQGDLKRLQMIFSADQIKQQRDTIIREQNLAAKANPYYNLGIHSKQLNEAIDLAKQLLTDEANKAQPPLKG